MTRSRKHSQRTKTDDTLWPTVILVRYFSELCCMKPLYSDMISTDGRINIEHIVAKSHINDPSGLIKNHPINIFPSFVAANSMRGNKVFGNSNTVDTFYPDKSSRGQISRVVMYMTAIHGDNFNSYYDFSLMMQWMKQYPPSVEERVYYHLIFYLMRKKEFVSNQDIIHNLWPKPSSQEISPSSSYSAIFMEYL